MQVVCLTVFRFPKVMDRLWAVGQMALGHWSLSRMKGLEFYRLMGSGTQEGFTPIPNTAVWGILTVWPDEEIARKQVMTHPFFNAYRRRAAESWTVFMEPTRARGKWGGAERLRPVPDDAMTPDGPVVALTRAQVRPGSAVAFWSRVPKIQTMIGADPNVRFKLGLGEFPLFFQMTFSIWPNRATMDAFARGETPHGQAIRSAYDDKWFTEDMYARLRVTGSEGTWNGADPLEGLIFEGVAKAA
ncbi:spheroidene monooxygenase [Rhodobacter sp. JA431]|nr:spheroidene monooxygenase [Rhodobacter sp. JA431]